jgi:hypothetical protein
VKGDGRSHYGNKKNGKEHAISARQAEEDNDQEMHECLARLKVWRIENLMSPTGMDRFAQDIGTRAD